MSAVLAVEEVLSHARASAYTAAQILGKDFALRTAGTPRLDGIEGTKFRVGTAPGHGTSRNLLTGCNFSHTNFAF